MNQPKTVLYVIGPEGERMTKADLPSPTIRRWMPKRKARVVAAVEGGLITRKEACERYAVSDEEYESWKFRLTHHGVKGLRITKTQELD